MSTTITTWLTLALLASQVTTAQKQQPEIPAFRAETRLVEVSVVVKDSDGKPVRNLERGDFEVYDNGQKQDIRIFRIEDYSSRAEESAELAPRPAASAHGMLSNRIPLDAAAPNAPTVLVIDAGHTWNIERMTWPDLVYAREQVIRFLQQLRPQDRLGIYFMGPERFWVLHEINQSCADLLERLAAWKREVVPDPIAKKYRDVWSEFAVRLGGADDNTAREIHRAQFWDKTALLSPMNDSLTVLLAVANHLGSVPGRKNVILITANSVGGTVPPPAILDKNVAVYPIDPAGLAPYALDASFRVPASVTARSSTPMAAAQRYEAEAYSQKRYLMQYLQNSLTALAEATGGQVFVNTNDILGAIRRSFDDSRVSYTLGFYPRETKGDREFHKLSVEIVGHGHLNVRHRSGYFEPATPSRDPDQRKFELDQFVWSPLDGSAIELNANVVALNDTDIYRIDVRIGVAGLTFTDDAGRRSGNLELVMAQRAEIGNQYDSVRQELRLHLKPETWEEALSQGFPHSLTLRLNPNASSVRIVVRDAEGANAGSLTIPRAVFTALRAQR